MYLSSKAAFVRNVAAAMVNGLITLILLLIAPLGLLAVIVNTFLVTLSTFLVCTVGDRVTIWLLKASREGSRFEVPSSQAEVLPVNRKKQIDSGDRDLF